MGMKLRANDPITNNSRNKYPGPGAYSQINTLSTNGRTVLSTVK